MVPAMTSNIEEIIADSEDELSLPDNGPGNGEWRSAVAIADISHGPTQDTIETADTSLLNETIPRKRDMDRTISQPPIAVLPEDSEVQSTIEMYPSPNKSVVSTKKNHVEGLTADPIQSSSDNTSSRPKPRRPQRKPAAATEGHKGNGTAADISSISTGSAASKGTPFTIDDIEDYSLSISERAKLSGRSRAAKNKKPAAVADVIILASDDDNDDLLLRPAPGSKKKAERNKPPQKRSLPKASSKAPAEDLFEPLPDSTPPDALPQATSEPNVGSQQLPPSDPPQPSPATNPPTSTPVESTRNGDAHSRSDPPVPAANDSSTHTPSDQSGILMPPPPPPFFAPSSSPSLAGLLSEATASTNGSSKRKRQPKDDGTTIEGSPPKSKPKTRKKKVVHDEDEDWNGDDEPAKKRNTKPKPKRPPKKKMVVEIPTKSSPVKPGVQNKAADLREKVADDKGSGNKGEAGPSKMPLKGPSAISESELSSLESEQEALKTKNSSVKKKANRKAKPMEGHLEDGSYDKTKSKGKGKRRAVVESEDEDPELSPPSPKRAKAKGKQVSPPPADSDDKDHGPNLEVESRPPSSPRTPAYRRPAPPSVSTSKASDTSLLYSIPKKAIPMSELIRKVASQPGSPFPAARSTYSPLIKTSKALLRKIAPLHPNRRTPPPPLPRPPPPKKTKKQLELEEKWEMELEDSVEGWYCMTEEERAALRKAKRNAELGFED